MRTLLIPAAGNGSRLESGDTPKALVNFANGTLISRVILEIQEMFDEILVVTKPGLQSLFTESFGRTLPPEIQSKIRFATQSEPSGSMDAICSGLHQILDGLVVVVWCDQIGVSKGTVVEVIQTLSEFDFVVPYTRTSFPYVWLNVEENQVSSVGRVRDGDSSPASGNADLGVFGFNLIVGSFLAEYLSFAEKNMNGRECDFTYAIPAISENFSTFLLERSNVNETLAVNSQQELRAAEKLDK